MTNYKEYSGKDYYKFVTELNKFLEENKVDFKSDDFLRLQKNQVNHLVRLERKYKEHLVKSGLSIVAYGKFIDYVLNKEKNLLVARPYFRERQKTFSKKITKQIKDRKSR